MKVIIKKGKGSNKKATQSLKGLFYKIVIRMLYMGA